ncbi:hypothetical protein FA13DRAFT_1732649 [Coprinellus micaceus]|uniref:Uncharacterized protein n=1 Tax=Coprinellus micaceus TaxID=71717 RepID=A0A4Y7TC66_COPMI|nr:hypothetical protein FA13DRAFT_1732649 [Coprinellus micaceus]
MRDLRHISYLHTLRQAYPPIILALWSPPRGSNYPTLPVTPHPFTSTPLQSLQIHDVDILDIPLARNLIVEH